MRRVRVVGAPGSGKSHLGAEIAAILGVAHLELDEVFWDRGWTFRDLDDAHRLVQEFVTSNPQGWVADGNWTQRLGEELDACDVVVWLDHPRPLTMGRLVRRTLTRGITRREIWHGNREDLRNLLRRDPEQNLVVFAWQSIPRLRARFGARAADPGDVVVRLSGRRAVEDWLERLRRSQASHRFIH